MILYQYMPYPMEWERTTLDVRHEMAGLEG